MRQAILDVAARRGDVQVFGSVARGEATAANDVDLLVRFEAGRPLFDRVHPIADLQEPFGVSVEVVAEAACSIATRTAWPRRCRSEPRRRVPARRHRQGHSETLHISTAIALMSAP